MSPPANLLDSLRKIGTNFYFVSPSLSFGHPLSKKHPPCPVPPKRDGSHHRDRILIPPDPRHAAKSSPLFLQLHVIAKPTALLVAFSPHQDCSRSHKTELRCQSNPIPVWRTYPGLAQSLLFPSEYAVDPDRRRAGLDSRHRGRFSLRCEYSIFQLSWIMSVASIHARRAATRTPRRSPRAA